MTVKAVAGPSAPHRVLIVEDEPEMRDLLADNLEFEGYRVAAVGSAEQALQRIERHSGSNANRSH
jgi:CheY-like chemotaxis protein